MGRVLIKAEARTLYPVPTIAFTIAITTTHTYNCNAMYLSERDTAPDGEDVSQF